MRQEIIKENIVYDELKKAIAEALRVDTDIIKPESVLTTDLEAESLDILDVTYKVEMTFGIKMARHFILEHAEEIFGEGSTIDDDGRLTEQAVTLLTKRIGKNISELRAGMEMEELATLITVESIAARILEILNTLPKSCPQCNASAWTSNDGTHTVCGSCGAKASFTSEDELMIQWLTETAKEDGVI